MNTRAWLTGLVATSALAGLTALPAEAAEPQPISHCSPSGYYGVGQTLSVDSYLTKSLSCRKGFVLAHGATLDLRGHTLTGLADPMSCVGCPAPVQDQPGHAGIILADGHLTNGHLEHWQAGVRVLAESPTSARARSVTRVSFRANDQGVYAFDNSDVVQISGSLFNANGLGVQVLDGGGFTIDNSVFSQNRESGLEMADSGDLHASYSVFSGNGASGVYTIDGEGTSVMSDDVFARNAQYGLLVGTGDQTVTVGNNLAVSNGLTGIYLSDDNTISDAGGNVAIGNGDNPQCLGAACS